MSTSRTQKFIVTNWNGGVNTSTDPGVLPVNDLVQADNVVFTTSGSRHKRQGIDQFDYASNVPALVSRSSSGTTRTLTFASNLQTTGPVIQRLVVGEQIAVSTSAVSGNEWQYYQVTSGAILTVSGATITYTATGSLTEGTTAVSSLLTLARSSTYIEVADFWYNSASDNLKTQAVLGLTSQGKLFSFDENGSRSEILAPFETSTVVVNSTDTGVTGSNLLLTGSNISVVTGDVYKDTSSVSFTILKSTHSSKNVLFSGANASIAAMPWTRFSGTGPATITGVSIGVNLVCNAATAAVGDTYTNSGHTYTVLQALSSGTSFLCSTTSSVATTGNYARATGSGTNPIVVTAGGDSSSPYFYDPFESSTTAAYFSVPSSSGTLNFVMSPNSVFIPPATGTSYPVTYFIGSSDTVIAAALVAAVNATGLLTAAAVGTTVTITDTQNAARTPAIADGAIATGFTLTETVVGLAPQTSSYAVFNAMNNRAIFSVAGGTNIPIYYNPNVDLTSWHPLAGSPPQSDFNQQFLARMWTNDRNNKDRLQYSATGNPEQWNGVSDSGALDINPGDADPDGITAIYPPFQGQIIVSKGKRLYRISGDSPENFQVVPISAAIGTVDHKAVAAIDTTDVEYISTRGIHSLSTTANYGDFSAEFVSLKIQPTFNTWPKQFLSASIATYWPEMNAVIFAVTEFGFVQPNAFWFFNIVTKGWHRWPSSLGFFQATAMNLYLDASETNRLIWGVPGCFIYRANNPAIFTDFYGTPAAAAVNFAFESGTIYPDQNPQTMKNFKKVSLLYRPKGRYSLTVSINIDNLPVQALSFAQPVAGAVLGSTFILGASVLGFSSTFAPFTVPVDGFGRGMTISVQNNNQDQQVEIYGFIIEYELADVNQETL